DAELVKNRSFEFPQPLMGWSTLPGTANDAVRILDSDPASANNRHYLRLTAEDRQTNGVANEGFRGIGVKAGEKYQFSVRGRRANGSRPALRVELVGADGRTLAEAKLRDFSGAWTRQSATFRPATTDAKSRLQLRLENGGALDLDLVSLLPDKTWRDHG